MSPVDQKIVHATARTLVPDVRRFLSGLKPFLAAPPPRSSSPRKRSPP